MKIEIKNFPRKKTVVLLFLLLFTSFFWGSGFSWADEDGLNYFQDKDGDGLTDQEELALGTDPEKSDTDGDGYSDKVEIESGYDPLVAAPGDRLIEISSEEVEVAGESDVNLTDVFLEKVQKNESSLFQDLDQETLTDLSDEKGGMNEEISSGLGELDQMGGQMMDVGQMEGLLSQTFSGAGIEEEFPEIKEEDLNILPKVKEENEKKKKKIEKKQIEEYLATLGFVMLTNAPFEAGNEQEFLGQLNFLIGGFQADIGQGNSKRMQEYKKRGEEVLDSMYELETPYVLKDTHQEVVQLVQYLINQNEKALFDQEDPIKMGLYLGKIQVSLERLAALNGEIQEVLKEYEIKEIGFSDEEGDSEQFEEEAEEEEGSTKEAEEEESQEESETEKD